MKATANTGDQRARQAIRCTWIGAVVDAVLGFAKIIIGWLFHSQALIADGIHSLSDLATDFMVVAVVRFANTKPDAEHPYGHERFETVATVFLGFLLVGVSGAMAYESSSRLLADNNLSIPGWPTLLVAAVSIAAKEAIYHYTLAVGKRIKSKLLIANAWHSRSDALSSIIVFVGIAGAMSGLPWLDSLAALAVAFLVARIGWKLSWDSLKELVDTAIEPETVESIREIALDVEGIQGIHNLKSRKMGSKKLLEMHLQVKPYVSASEAHFLGDAVVHGIHSRFDDIGPVIYHIDTEQDVESSPNTNLPGRREVTEVIDSLLNRFAPQLRRNHLTLHYLRGQLEIDLVLATGSAAGGQDAASAQQLLESLNGVLAEYSWFGHLNLWYSPGET